MKRVPQSIWLTVGSILFICLVLLFIRYTAIDPVGLHEEAVKKTENLSVLQESYLIKSKNFTYRYNLTKDQEQKISDGKLALIFEDYDAIMVQVFQQGDKLYFGNEGKYLVVDTKQNGEFSGFPFNRKIIDTYKNSEHITKTLSTEKINNENVRIITFEVPKDEMKDMYKKIYKDVFINEEAKDTTVDQITEQLEKHFGEQISREEIEAVVEAQMNELEKSIDEMFEQIKINDMTLTAQINKRGYLMKESLVVKFTYNDNDDEFCCDYTVKPVKDNYKFNLPEIIDVVSVNNYTEIFSSLLQ